MEELISCTELFFCYDELETYFIVHEVTQQLDDDSSDSVLDFKIRNIRNPRRYIRKKKASWLMFGGRYF